MSVHPVPATSVGDGANEFAGFVVRQPLAGTILDAPQGYVNPCSLQEGDFLLSLALDPISCCIATLGTSFGSSHCGSIIRMPDGKLYVAESRQGFFSVFEHNGVSGVVATPLGQFLSVHIVNTAYRPDPPLTQQQLVKMREAFNGKLGQPYRLNALELCNAGFGCSLYPIPSRGLFCSQLTSILYDSVGVLEPRSVCCGVGCLWGDMRRPTHSYRPSDMPLVIPSKRLGTMIRLPSGSEC